MTEYFKFILSIQLQNRKKGDGNLYYKHHILPRSLYPLLKNKKWNIILLTPSEHRMAHFLLSKCTIGKCQETMERVYKQYYNS